MYYKKVPHEVRAVHFTLENLQAVEELLFPEVKIRNIPAVMAEGQVLQLSFFDSNNKHVVLEEGEWIIKDKFGKISSCKDYEFEANYEAVKG